MSWGRPTGRPWMRYAAATLFVAIAGAVRALFPPVVEASLPYLTLYPAVTFAALYGGAPAGLLAMFLSALLIVLSWTGPAASFSPYDSTEWVGMALFLASSAVISGIAEAMQRAKQRTGEAAAQSMLAGERAEEREITIEFLQLVNRGEGARDMIRAAVGFFQERFQCEAVGIRLKQGDDYPYVETRGFSPEFVSAESSLFARNGAGEIERDSSGNPVLACMCGSVICGRVDPSKPFFTKRGSLRTGRVEDLLGCAAAADCPALRGRCAVEGYESVALIPLRVGREQFGILQLNDRRKGFFSPEKVDLWERLADYLAVVLGKVLAEEALRASLDRYRSYVEVTGQLGWTANAGGEVSGDMPSWRAYTGQSREAIRGWGWSKALHPEDLKRVVREWKMAVAAKSVYQAECRIRRHDGAYRHFLSRAVPLQNEDGGIREWVGACIDITDRKDAEDSLRKARDELENRVRERTAQVREQARMLEAFFTHGQTCVAFLDREFNFIRVNEAYARACARRASDFIGRNHFVEYPSEDLREKFRQVLETKQRYRAFGKSFEFPGHPEWGVSYWDLHVAPILDESGEVEFLAFSLIDVTDREEAKVALEESEERYRSVFDNSIDGILITAPAGEVLAANPEACRIFGRPEREMRGIGRAEIVDMTNPGMHAFIEERARTGKARGEVIAIRKDGTKFPCEQSSAQFQAKDGNARNIVIIRDITEHKRDEERIFRLNRLYSVLSKVSEAIVRIRDPEELYEQVCRIAVEDGLFTMAWVGLIDPVTGRVRPAASYGDAGGYLDDITIYAADVPEGRGPAGRAAFQGTYAICRDIELDGLRPWRDRALQQGFRSLASFPIRRGPDVIGAFTIYSDKAQFFTDEETALLNSLAEDVSFALQSMANEEKRRRTEEDLRLANAYNRSLLEASIDPLVTIDTEGKIRDANLATEMATGYPARELIGADFSDYFTEPEKARSGYQRVFREGFVRDYPLEILHRDGRITPVLYNASLYRDDKGRVVGVFAAARDVTERRRAEAEVRKLNEELERRVAERTAQLEASNKELEAFSYSVSHDLRAPLRAIDGFSRKVLIDYRDKLDDEGKRFLNVIRRNTQEMGQLINDLLALSRVGRQKVTASVIDMEDLARTVYDDIQASVPGRTIRFTIDAPPPALADKSLIRQVLVNLLSNAVKFTGPRNVAQIEFGGKANGVEKVYYVKDNGVGFDIRYADKLFGLFHRLHGADEFEGTGVGLAIVKRTIGLHGGRVWAEAKVDEGATFFFTLPG